MAKKKVNEKKEDDSSDQEENNSEIEEEKKKKASDIISELMANDENLDIKFWQKSDHFRSLLDPEIIKKLDLTHYDLAKLLNEFFNEMFKEDFIDFKVSGIAVHSAAKIYRWKILEILEDQERIQEEKRREALRRNIPDTISQPLRPGRQIATKEDFMGSMRSAIIEVMRKREKAARRNAKKKKKVKAEVKKTRTKKKLPQSLMKAILGKERIEDTFQNWFNTMVDKIKKDPDNQISYLRDLKPLIEKKDPYGYRFDLARLFLSMMFLRNRSKIDLFQEDELSDIYITREN